ncbi:SET domain-containing protein [Westerdykella ornata]|uniref:SET domain-containing protein n=1 Tax=Westerdykella ornata TaxID=318751 RepID=A0A6A6J847_WESOR|nr:SET domain-containing protein [Westerdykella ornata]KAF2272760.1 SET domain-containing protein [Westerdykella ornata]
MTDFDGASEQFLAWLQRSGAILSDKIELRDLRDCHAGRGVVATQDIEVDELLFRIPRSSVLSVENSILSKEIPKATFEYLGPWLSLILVMLYEYKNGPSSNWAPYFNVLPTRFNTLMFWEEDELDQLQASAVRNKIGKEEADETFTTQLVPVIEEFAEIIFSGDELAKDRAKEMRSPENLEFMHKMGSLIMAYAFDIEPAESKKEADEEGYVSEEEDEALPKGMVPMADMLNADADRNNARLFYEEDSLSMKAIKPIKAGEEVFNDYGALPRSDLLRRYGYITDNYAQYDVVEIPLELISAALQEENPGRYKKRMEYLEEQDLVETGYDIAAGEPFDIQECISPELIMLVQALLMTDADFESMSRSGKLPKPKRMAARDAEFLQRVVRARAEQYGTTLEEDLGTSNAPAPESDCFSKGYRYAMARAVRIGEKKILKAAEEVLGKLVQELGGSNGAGKRKISNGSSGPGKKLRAK